MKIFSTFSGIGGFEIGIERAFNNRPNLRNRSALLSENSPDTSESPLRFVGYSEIDKYAIKVYEYQFGGECENCRLARERERNSSTSGRQEALDSERTRLSQTVRDNDNAKNERSESDRVTCEHSPKNYGDITKINAKELPDFDCLVGGFPCQAFSIAGKRKGFEDTRGTLFFDLARILRAKQPRLFVFENVKGLLSHDGGQTFKTIIQTIDELGYDCQWQVLNSKNFGVPQNRERVYIVGHSRNTPRPEVFPLESNYGETSNEVTDKGQLVDLTRREPSNYRERKDGRAGTLDANYYKGLANQERPGVIVAQRGRGEPPVQRLEARPDDITNTITSVQKDNMVLDDTYGTGLREYKDTVPTLRTGRHGLKVSDDVRIRRLTPIECERLQGFPDNWTSEGIDGAISDTQRYKMCGNAVTTNVVQAVFERILA